MARGILLFDADCGFCAASARQVPRLRLPVEVVALQAADLRGLGVDPERALVEMPFVDARGRVHYGHRGWAGALRTGVLPLRLLGALITLPGLDGLAARVYRWVAQNRQRLPGGTPSCSLGGPDAT